MPGKLKTAVKYVEEILANREEILRAFIAKYGCEPDEVVQVWQNEKWWVEKRKINSDTTD